MSDRETWKTGTDCDKMEKLIKYHMHVQYQKSIFLKKKKLSQVNIKKSVFYSMSDMFKNTHQPHWEIQMDWENDV